MYSRIYHLFLPLLLFLVLSVEIIFAQSDGTEHEVRHDADRVSLLLDLTDSEKEWLIKHPVLRIAGPKAFPPFHFYDKNKSVQGMAADYMRLVFNQLHLEMDIQSNLPWPEVLQGVKKKSIDLIACTAKTKEREKYLLFSDPYMSFPLVIITRKDAPFVGGLEDLHGKIVSVVNKNSTYDWLVEKNVEITPHFVATPKDALLAVSLGRADANIENLAAASYIIQENGLTNLKIAGPTSFGNYELYISVRKDWPELVQILNKSLAGISASQHTEIRNRWLSVKYEHGIDKHQIVLWIGIISALGVTALIVFFLWNRSLERQIVDKKKAEKALHDQRAALTSIFRAVPVGIGVVVDRVIVKGNTRLFQITGYKEEELLNKNSRSLYLTQEEYDYVGENKYNQIAEYGTGTVETRWCRKDGSIIDVHLSSTPFDADDLTKGVTFSVLDITQQKQLEEDLRQSHKMEAIGTLAGGIAHDFNNILGIIMGYTELAKDSRNLLSSDKEYLNGILTATKRAKDLVNQLLMFGRKKDVAREMVSLEAVVHEVMKLLRSTLPVTIQFKVDSENNLPVIEADPTQIQQVILNLAMNAADAMAENGGILQVSLTRSLFEDEMINSEHLGPGHFIKMSVSDTGDGITAENLERIFDPYFTTKEISKGSGLGLSVTHGIVESHKGTIRVFSTLGEGTTFEVFWPAKDGVFDEEEKKENELLKGTERILFVDDEKLLVLLNKRRLEKLGYQVDTLTDSREALTLFQRNPQRYDLVITDMTMPEMTGDIMAQEMKKMRPDLPVILCTGYSHRITEEKAGEYGFSKFLHKPVEIEQMAVTLRQVLDK